MAFVNNTAFAQQHTDSLLSSYLKMKDALVKSNSKQSMSNAKEFFDILESENDFPEKKALTESVKTIMNTDKLEKQRNAFAVLSLDMWKVVERAESLPGNVYYQYCPMKKMYWLSSEEVIRNPYYGSEMLTCGNVSDKKVK
jgi:hypothetical protein